MNENNEFNLEHDKNSEVNIIDKIHKELAKLTNTDLSKNKHKKTDLKTTSQKLKNKLSVDIYNNLYYKKSVTNLNIYNTKNKEDVLTDSNNTIDVIKSNDNYNKGTNKKFHNNKLNIKIEETNKNNPYILIEESFNFSFNDNNDKDKENNKNKSMKILEKLDENKNYKTKNSSKSLKNAMMKKQTKYNYLFKKLEYYLGLEDNATKLKYYSKFKKDDSLIEGVKKLEKISSKNLIDNTIDFNFKKKGNSNRLKAKHKSNKFKKRCKVSNELFFKNRFNILKSHNIHKEKLNNNSLEMENVFKNNKNNKKFKNETTKLINNNYNIKFNEDHTENLKKTITNNSLKINNIFNSIMQNNIHNKTNLLYYMKKFVINLKSKAFMYNNVFNCNNSNNANILKSNTIVQNVYININNSNNLLNNIEYKNRSISSNNKDYYKNTIQKFKEFNNLIIQNKINNFSIYNIK